MYVYTKSYTGTTLSNNTATKKRTKQYTGDNGNDHKHISVQYGDEYSEALDEGSETSWQWMCTQTRPYAACHETGNTRHSAQARARPDETLKEDSRSLEEAHCHVQSK